MHLILSEHIVKPSSQANDERKKYTHIICIHIKPKARLRKIRLYFPQICSHKIFKNQTTLGKSLFNALFGSGGKEKIRSVLD